MKYVRPHVLELLLRLLISVPLKLFFVELVRLGYRLAALLPFLILAFVVEEHSEGGGGWESARDATLNNNMCVCVYIMECRKEKKKSRALPSQRVNRAGCALTQTETETETLHYSTVHPLCRCLRGVLIALLACVFVRLFVRLFVRSQQRAGCVEVRIDTHINGGARCRLGLTTGGAS